MAVGFLRMNTNLRTRESALEYQILDELKELGFQTAESEGLDSPAFPGTFSPSAFHQLVRRCASKEPETLTRWAGSDWVFRHVDLDKIGFSPTHLSTFKMLVFLEAVSQKQANDSRERTVQIVLRLLKRSLKLRANQLYITYFGGHMALPSGLADQDELQALWRHAGVPQRNLIAISGTANLTNVVRTGEPAGPRCEIFLRDSHGTFVEIGTVVFECLIVAKTHPLEFKSSSATVCGAAFGLERCEMVSHKSQDIFQSPKLRSALGVIESDLHPNLAGLGGNQVRRIVDAIRTAMIIVSNTRTPLSRARKDRVRDVRNIIFRAATSLGYEDIPALVDRVVISLSDRNRFNDEIISSAVRTLLWPTERNGE